MSTDAVKVAAEALEVALNAVENVRAYRDPSAVLVPPGVVIGPPRLAFEAYCLEPTSATFPLYLVVKFDDRVLERMWSFVPTIAAAVDKVPGAAVTRADPGVFNANGQDMPCYEITTEVAL